MLSLIIDLFGSARSFTFYPVITAVRLGGFVDSTRERDAAAATVSKVAGVLKAFNNLTVR